MNKTIRMAIGATALAVGLALPTVLTLASESPTPAAETKLGTPDQHTRKNAKEANEAAVNEAVVAVIAANRLDLDIRLIGNASITVAAEK